MRLGIHQGTVPIWAKFDDLAMSSNENTNILEVKISEQASSFGPFSIQAVAVRSGVAPLPGNFVTSPIEFDPFYHAGGTGSIVLIRVFRRPPPTLPPGTYDVYAFVGSNGGFKVAKCSVTVPESDPLLLGDANLQGTVPIWASTVSDISSAQPHTDGSVDIDNPQRGVALASSHVVIPAAGGPAESTAVTVALASPYADTTSVAFGVDYTGGLSQGAYVVQITFSTQYGSVSTTVNLQVT